MFSGLDGDGTIGANKAAIKNLTLDDGLNAQGYFSYDSHKGMEATISHLRFGGVPIGAHYMINSGWDDNACHHPSYVRKFDLLVDKGLSLAIRAQKSISVFLTQLDPFGWEHVLHFPCAHSLCSILDAEYMDVERFLLGKQSIWFWPIPPHFHNAIEGEMPC